LSPASTETITVDAAHTRRSSNGCREIGFVLLALALGCDDQPKPNCATSTLAYAVKLIERSRDGACDTFGPAGFNAVPEVGLATYYTRDKKGQPNYDMGSVAIQTAELGTYVANATTYDQDNTADEGSLYSLGKFAGSRPDDSGLCTVPKLSTTRVVLAELPEIADDPSTEEEDESFPGQPALDITLEWSGIKVLVTPGSYGTQFEADLTDTRVAPDGETCTIRYRALGLTPAIPCGATDADSGMPLFDDAGAPVLVPVSCDPRADPDEGRFEGSGISPETRYVCDPEIAYCVPAGDKIPALQ
jgi:hypothetical protein